MPIVHTSRMVSRILSLAFVALLVPLAGHAQASNKAVDDMMTQAQAALSKGKMPDMARLMR